MHAKPFIFVVTALLFVQGDALAQGFSMRPPTGMLGMAPAPVVSPGTQQQLPNAPSLGAFPGFQAPITTPVNPAKPTVTPTTVSGLSAMATQDQKITVTWPSNVESSKVTIRLATSRENLSHYTLALDMPAKPNQAVLENLVPGQTYYIEVSKYHGDVLGPSMAVALSLPNRR